jgi:gliding motility-associated-like protein
MYELTVQSPPQVVASFESDIWITTTDATLINLTNTSENASAIEWSISNQPELTSTNDIWAVTLPEEVGIYQVVLNAFDEFGCADEYRAVIEIRDNFYVYIPNTFTPNSDGTNDVFIPQFSYKPEYYYLEIYNRWGQLIFESNDSSQAWTGEHLNGDYFVQDGEYEWILKVKGLNVDYRTFKGNVLIIR